VIEQNRPHVYDIYIGGLFSGPVKTKIRKPGKTKRKLLKMLQSTNVVKRVWKHQIDTDTESFGDVVIGRFERKKGYFDKTHHWYYPVMLKLLVEKEPVRQKESTSSGTFEANVLYNGVWFMALVDQSQFSSVSDYFESGPQIRDKFVEIVKECKLFKPTIIPPCIMHTHFVVHLYNQVDKCVVDWPEYSDTKMTEGSKGLIVEYQMKKSKITERDAIMILKDIYFDIQQPITSFYLLAERADTVEEKHDSALQKYNDICIALEEYIGVSFWNLFKKWILASKLNRNIARIQLELVSSRIDQASIENELDEFTQYSDRKSILMNMKADLQESIMKPFSLGNIEYEGLMSTLNYVDKLTSQHNTTFIGIIAIVSGIIGAIIGAILGALLSS
jgi:hypothetical protein